MRTALLVAAALAGCRGPLPTPPDRRAEASIDLRLEPDAALDAAPSVVRVHARVEVVDAASLMLFRGELSSYHLGRIATGDLPETLRERRVPVLAWQASDASDVVVAPSVPLEKGEIYSLASPSQGLLGTLSVSADAATPFFSRVWPPRDGGAGAGRLILCGDAGHAEGSDTVLLEPAGVTATPGAGADPARDGGDGCLRLEPDRPLEAGELVVPPARLGGVALDPAPLQAREAPPPAPLGCADDEIGFGPGCARVADDRAVIRSPAAPLLWIVGGEAAEALENTLEGGRFVLRGLAPSARARVRGTVLDRAGRATAFEAELRTGPPQAHLVLDEILANPLGPEPQQEWIEITNDGSEAASLGGWSFEDAAASVALPPAMLAPGERVLVVPDGFVPDHGFDVAPAPRTRLIVVPALAGGLANAGELLQLRAPDGSVASRFPAEPAPKAGVSVARRHPWSLDDDPESFALHAAPGASPGAPNVVLAP